MLDALEPCPDCGSMKHKICGKTMTEDKSAHPQLPPLSANRKAERDKALEVIWEYRELPTHDHRRCHEHVYYAGLGYKDDRCPTCIKADELLKEQS